MQVNVNQDAAIRQYTQTAQKMGKTSTVAAEAPDMKEIVSSVQKQDVDCAEFNKDRAVTSKMSESERSSLGFEQSDVSFYQYDDADLPEAGDYSQSGQRK